MNDLLLLVITVILVFFLLFFLSFYFFIRERKQRKKAEEVRDLFEKIFHNLPFEAILFKDREIVRMNRRALETLGADPKIEDFLTGVNRKGRKFEALEVSLSENYRLLILQDVTERESLKSAYQMALSYLSHELKTPFAIASGYLERLEDSFRKGNPSEELLIKTKEAFQRMEKLLRKLLSSIEYLAKDIRIKREEIRVRELIEEALFWVSPLAEEKSVEIEFSEDLENLRVRGAPDLLIQALFNVIENAVKASPPGKKVVIKTYTLNASKIVLSIRDFGPGVSSDKLSLLAMPFFKLRDDEGLGLGLFITKRIIEAHGGTINFSLPQGGGLEVQIILPI